MEERVKMTKTKKVLSIILTVLLVANITFFALGKLGVWQFWISLAVIALLAHFGMPRIR